MRSRSGHRRGPGYTEPLKFTDGNPYGASHVGGMGDMALDEAALAPIDHLARRTVWVAERLNAGDTSA